MTHPPQPLPGPWQPRTTPVFPAQTLTVTVPDLPCGHLDGDLHDGDCAYWAGVAEGVYPPPESYLAGGEYAHLLPHAPGLAPLVDPALRGAA
ncbi:hypothetical protein ABZ738_05635 [Micromonospora sp. NPDC047793]|uniref:hypothetical protein n=1 Tax=Micromonospora sp. NPDC047793 TaxID=3154342 RepID=UPI0033EE5203